MSEPGDRSDFLRAELTYLREKIGRQQDRQIDLLKFGLGGMAAYYAFVFSELFSLVSHGVHFSAKLIPVMFTAFGLLACLQIRRSIDRRAEYLRQRETEILGDAGGWEVHYKTAKARDPRWTNRDTWLISWVTLLAFAIFVAVFVDVAP